MTIENGFFSISVILLYSYGELEEEDCEQVEQLVFCSERLVAQEAGAFLNARLLLEVEANSPTKKKGKRICYYLF